MPRNIWPAVKNSRPARRNGRISSAPWAAVAFALVLLISFVVSRPTAVANAQSSNKISGPQAATANDQVMGYFTEWGVYEGFTPKSLITSGSAAKMTTLYYAFSNVSAGRCAIGDPLADYNMAFTSAESIDGVADGANASVLRGNFHQLQLLKARFPNLKVVISVGGWTWSGGFSALAATATSRETFVASCIDTFIEGNFSSELRGYNDIFDGIDIDWEFPGVCGVTCNFSPQDPQNFTALLAEFRSQLDELTTTTGKRYSLHIATSAAEDTYSLLQLNQIPQYLDTINLMAYDMHTGSEGASTTNFQSALARTGDSREPVDTNNVGYAVQYYIGAGVPANKIIMGVPFYGRGWSGVTNSNNGLFQPSTGLPSGTTTGENGYENYKVLKNMGGYTRYRDSQSQAPWMFNGSTFWSYDDPTSIAFKMSYVKTHGLGGTMFWDASGDDASGSLVTAMYNGLHQQAPATQTPTTVPTATRTSTPPPAGSTATSTPQPGSCTISFSDVRATDFFYEPVRYLYCAGIISGYTDNTFRPFANTTRAQLAKIIVGAQGWAIASSGGPHFNDVPTNHSFYSFIETAFNHGVISGYGDGSFKPFNNVTRGQLSKIVVKAQGWLLVTPLAPTFVDVTPANAFYKEIETAVQNGIISGYDVPGVGREFRWSKNATRGQISKIVYSAISSNTASAATKKP